MINKRNILIGALLIGAYTFGAITVQYKLFPFNQVVEYIYKQKYGSMALYEKNTKYRILTDMYNNAYDTKSADIVMLGDSITYGANWNELLNNSKIVNRGIGSDITEGFINRLDNVIRLNPKKVFIMGGINDIGKGIEIDIIYNNYINIVQELQKNNIQPIIQSTLFTTHSKHSKHSKHSNKVSLLNKNLKEYANTEDIEFIDLNKGLSKDGYLIEEYSTDGVHLNAKGYNIWKKEIRQYIK